MDEFITLNKDNVETEHLCCAMADKKHQTGVNNKKEWLKSRFTEGHIFRKLNKNGKIFIEYAPLEKAWTVCEGNNFLYIYCLWVAGSYKGKGYAKTLLQSAIDDAKAQGKNGLCTITSKKKKPFVSEKKFFEKFGFKVVDEIQDYELLALTFNNEKPNFIKTAKQMEIPQKEMTIFYSPQCPFTNNSIQEINEFAKNEKIKINTIKIDTLEKAKSVPCVFNNWANFINGKFISNTLLNKNSLEKLLQEYKIL